MFVGLLYILIVCSLRANTIETNDIVTQSYLGCNHTQGFDHWLEYGKHYSVHTHHLHKKSEVRMTEVGVQSGGSSRLWFDIFGQKMRYTGIDINPNCIEFAEPSMNIGIEIGRQLNRTFLQGICQKYGPFDFVVDDGGHSTDMIITTFEALWPCMNDGGVYAIEDLHTMWLWKSGWKNVTQMIVNGQDVYDYFGSLGREATSHFDTPSNTKTHYQLGKHISSMHFYDSLIFLSYQEHWKSLTHFKRGKRFIPYAR